MQARNTRTTENILERYTVLTKAKSLQHDAAQYAVAERLSTLQIQLEKYYGKTSLLKPFKNKPKPRGIYLYGDVGRGKSLLMDMVFETTPLVQKRRCHFHAFMQEIHHSLHQHQLKKTAAPLPKIAKRIADHTKLLCFDEMQISDITDAMLVGKLFSELLEHGITCIITSNRHPDDLYKDGLQRESFLPFIQLLKEQLDIIPLDADKDYRLSHLKSLSTVYFTPLGKAANTFTASAFAELSYQAKPAPYSLQVNGRAVQLKKTHGDIAWVSFKELCEQTLGAADYLELAREFSTIIMENIPEMGKDKRNEAKRFVTLIDALYEHRVNFICSATAPPEKLYTKGDGSFEFKRTVSRLMEMQSESYLTTAHIA